MNAKELVLQQPKEVRDNAIIKDDRLHIPVTLYVDEIVKDVDLSDPEVCPNMKSLMIVLRGKGKRKRTIDEMLSNISR